MSKFMITCWLWIMLIVKLDCAVIRLDHSKRMKDGLEYVMQKYLSPLRKLTAELPNHAIEMQIEIHESVPNSPQTKPTPPPRRLIRILPRYPNKPIKRSNDDGTPEDSSNAAPPPPPPPPAAQDPLKLPVYMDDLKKALDDLEKKIVQGTASPAPAPAPGMSTSSCNGDHGPVQFPPSLANNSPPFRNIDDIVQLLKKAIHVEKRIPKPMDENVEWVQLKIPKNLV